MGEETTDPKSNGGVIMNEDFVPFELAKKLKYKGFPQRAFGSYDMVGPTYFSDGRFFKDGCICYKDEAYTAPTISQVLKWLRDEKKIHIQITVYENGWYFEVWQYDESPAIKFQSEDCDSYEQAALAGIEYCLDNLI